MMKVDFRKQMYEKKKEQEKQNMFLAKSLYEKGEEPSVIAIYMGTTEAMVRYYLRKVIKE